MAKHPSAIRQHRRSLRRNIVNRKNKAVLRSQVRKLRQAIQKNDKETARKLIPSTTSLIDKTVKKGAVHKNRGDRLKSRLTRKVDLINSSASD